MIYVTDFNTMRGAIRYALEKGAQPMVTNPLPKKLEDYSRESLNNYMIDCHGFEKDQVAEWETKTDLCADIRSFGWETEALEYLA